MGALLLVVGDAPAANREASVRAMAERAAYRGRLASCTTKGPVTVGIQARAGDASVHLGADVIVAVHGYLYVPAEQPGESRRSAASTLAARWAISGAAALGEVDGEFSALILEQASGRAWVCNSLSGTRPLYWARGRTLLVAASEVRQVAIGAGLEPRPVAEGVVELLCFHGVRLEPEQTELNGINRLAAPWLYRIDTARRCLCREGRFWSPPETQDLTAVERAALPEQTAGILTRALASLPSGAGFAVSGGYDSGLLWVLANRDRGGGPMPRAYALTFPGLASDERPVLRALLEYTTTEARFLPADQVKASARIDAAIASTDRMLAAPTFTNLEVLADAIATDGGDGIVTGTGAEVALEATETYAADLLRRGRWLTLALDAFRFRTYIAGEAQTVAGRLSYFAKIAVAPPGGRYRRRKLTPPRWLDPRWHEHWRAGAAQVMTAADERDYARSERLALLGDLGNLATENYEQICQRYGLAAYHPYLHRSALDLGLSVPARASNRGLHTKQLLRDAARWAMQGREPPWPKRKVVFDSQVAADHELVRPLGPGRNWGLVQAGILKRAFACEITARAERQAPVRPVDSIMALAERHWQRCG